MAEINRSRGMRTFIIIWIGQFVSMLGTGMTNLGIPIWIYARTGRATDLTTMGGLFVAALLIVSPFTGVLIDRSNRKLMMMLSDLAAGLATVGIFVLYSFGRLEIWHLFVSAVIQGAFQSFQWPAFSSAISAMVPKEQYTRTATMMDLANNGARILAPMAGGALLGFLGSQAGLRAILLIDIVTFVVAVGTLVFVFIPQPEITAAQREAEEGGFLQEVLFGFRYIWERPSLLGLQCVFMVGNIFLSVPLALLAAMLLARTGSDEMILASVMSIASVGGVVGGVVMSAWGGFKRRVNGVLLGFAFNGLLGITVVGLGRGDWAWAALPVWGAGMFLTWMGIPLVNGSNQAIWQSKVPPDVQGKVFSIRRLIAWFVSPLSRFVAGPLADFVLEPAMAEGGNLTGLFGWLVGSGPGAGMSLIFVVSGVMMVAVGLGGYLFRAIRDVEDILPDHEAKAADQPPPDEEAAPEPAPA